MLGEQYNESEEDKRPDECILKYLKNVRLEHVDIMLEASTETQESHGFETKKLCVYVGYAGHGDRQPP